jgi:hypothetical protein
MKEPFSGFLIWDGWIYSGVVCQLMAWLSISYATQHMRPNLNFLKFTGATNFYSGLAILDEK